jgi:hypothetical protein
MKALLAMLVAIVLLAGCGSNVEPELRFKPDAYVTTSNAIGIGNSKVWVGSDEGMPLRGREYYPGATAEYTLPIYNSYPVEKVVSLSVAPFYKKADVIRKDGGLDFDYEIAPAAVADWVQLPASEITIPANGMVEVLAIFRMPKTVKEYPSKWEFRITVEESGQGFIGTAVSQRWLVTMR